MKYLLTISVILIMIGCESDVGSYSSINYSKAIKTLGVGIFGDSIKYVNNEYSDKEVFENHLIQSDTIGDLVISKIRSKTNSTSLYLNSFYPIEVTVLVLREKGKVKQHISLNNYDLQISKYTVNSCEENTSLAKRINNEIIKLLQTDLNYLVNYFGIKDIAILSSILDIYLGHEITDFYQFGYERYINYLNKSGDYKTEENNCCKNTLHKEKTSIARAVYKPNKGIFQSQMRGVYEVEYLKNENTISIDISYKLLECNKILTMYRPFLEMVEHEKIMYTDDKRFKKGK